MSSVTFTTAVGGDGSTVSDDASPTTGLANGGHRTRFVPALSQMVAVANGVVNNATTVAGQVTAATTQAGISTAQATVSTNQATISTNQATISTTQAGIATAAAATSSTNAGVYATTAAGLAGTSSGGQFQVISSDGLTYNRYRNDSGTATLVGSFPSAGAVTALQQPDEAVGQFQNLFDDPDFSLRDISAYMASYASSTPTRALDTSAQFAGVFGPSLCFTGAATSSTYMGAIQIKKTDLPAAFVGGDVTIGFWMKSSAGGTFRQYQPSQLDTVMTAGKAVYVQRTFTVTTQTSLSVAFGKVSGAFAAGEQFWVSPFIVYLGAARSLRSYRSLTSGQARDLVLAADNVRQWGRVVDLYGDFLLRKPASNGLPAYNDAVVAYDTTEVFSGVTKCYKVTWPGTSANTKAQFYFRTADGYAVAAGETLNVAFKIKSTWDHQISISAFGTTTAFYLKAGVERMLEFRSTYASASSGDLAISLINYQGIAGELWVTQPIYCKGKSKAEWALAPVRDWDVWGKGRFLNKKVAFLGDSMSVNRPWESFIVSKYGFYWDSTETTTGVGGYRPTAVGGTLVQPVIGIGTNTATNSIYSRADDLVQYAPDVVFVFGGINDKTTISGFGSASGVGKTPLGTANDTALTGLTSITLSDYNAGNVPSGYTFGAVYAGLVQKVLTALPNAKVYLMTMYPHNARNTTSSPYLPRDITADQLAQIQAMNGVIRGIGKRYSCPVIDLEYNGNFPAFSFNTDYWIGTDGTHLSDLGSLRMGDCIAESLGQS